MSIKLGRKLNIIILASVFLVVAIIFYQSINIDYKIEDGSIKINWFSGVEIPIGDITEIRVLDKVPQMTKITGIDILGIRQGVYTVEGIGRVKMYISDIGRKLVLVKTISMTYGLTPENTPQFVNAISIK